MRHLRRDRLLLASDKHDVNRRVGRHDETDRAFQNPELPPHAVGNTMIGPQAGGQAFCVEGPGCSHDVEAGREFGAIAIPAVELGSDPFRRVRFGRVRVNALLVEANQVRHPVIAFLAMESDDGTKHLVSRPGPR